MVSFLKSQYLPAEGFVVQTTFDADEPLRWQEEDEKEVKSIHGLTELWAEISAMLVRQNVLESVD